MHADNQFEEESTDTRWEDSFFEAFSKETDRATGIISICYLDNLLEKLIKAAYIKDSRIKSLFRDDHLLQSFSAKTNIAYFSGVIPEIVYSDLKLTNEIRNRFAHEPTAEMKFSDKIILQKINSFAQLPPEVIDTYSPRLKFILIVTHIGALLRIWREVLNEIRPFHPAETFTSDKQKLQELILTPTEIYDIIHKKRTSKEIIQQRIKANEHKD